MKLDLKIRQARAEDAPAIHNAHMRSIREVCIKDHGPEEVKGWGNREMGERWTAAIARGDVWVVDSGEKILGLACMSEIKNAIVHIHALYLTPEAIGQGLGKKLFLIMKSKAIAQGAKKLTLGSTLTAHDFYLSLGFEDDGPMERHEIGGSMVSGYDMTMILD